MACLLSGVLAPYAGFSELLNWTFGDPPSPYSYVLSWVGLGLDGMLAMDGFALHFARRNRRSIRAACVCLALFALSWLPIFAAIDSMGRTVEARGAARRVAGVRPSGFTPVARRDSPAAGGSPWGEAIG